MIWLAFLVVIAVVLTALGVLSGPYPDEWDEGN